MHEDSHSSLDENVTEVVDSGPPSPSWRGRKSLRTLCPGQRVLQYELIRELGAGGMSVVYLARDTSLARKVAIKFLRTDNPEHAEILLTEARATARCTHENIVVIHEINQHDGAPFIVLEYLEGRTVQDILSSGSISSHRALEIMIPVVRALARAHTQGIIHRDLKPSNIMLTDSGTVKVLDFGIAQILPSPDIDTDFSSETPSKSFTGPIVGTISYTSPEQLRAEELDGRADVWSVGMTLYQMLVGYLPLDGFSKIERIAHIVSPKAIEPPPEDASIPQHLKDIIERCLQKTREDRFPSALAMLEALESQTPQARAFSSSSHENPYPGLASFQVSDADRYFGRSQEATCLIQQFATTPFICLSGPTGIGKSSFVRAGIVAAIQQDESSWQTHVVRPGRNPLSALARLIDEEDITKNVERLQAEPGYLGTVLRERARTAACKILVVIDPFEELYTLTESTAVRKAFTACLGGIGDDIESPLRLLISMRSDFLDRLSEDGPFMRSAARNLVLLGPLERIGLTEALTRPAEMAGYCFENSKLVDEILDAVHTTPHSLPLLQFAALRLWEARDQNQKTLTTASYDRMGGLVGALTGHADKTVADIARFSPGSLNITKAIFRKLVTPDQTRALISVDAILQLSTDSEEVRVVLDRLVEARLLVAQSTGGSEGPTLELVHDSLIHNWHQLKSWIETDQEEQRFLAEIEQAAELWVQRGRPADEVWRGAALAEADRMLARCTNLVPGKVKDFLRVGHRHERLHRWRRRGFVGAALAILTVALVVVSFQRMEAVRQKSIAEEARQDADRKRAESDREAAEAAFVQRDMVKARAKIRSALELTDSTSSRALWWQIRRDSLRWWRPTSSTIHVAQFSPDGRYLVGVQADSTVTRYDVDTQEAFPGRLPITRFTVGTLSSDGALFAVVDRKRQEVLLWDVIEQRVLWKSPPQPARISKMSIRGDKKLLAIADNAGALRLWRISDGSLSRVLCETGEPIQSVYFATKDRLVSMTNASLQVWNLVHGTQDRLDLEGTPRSFRISPDGHLLAVSTDEGPIQIWSLKNDNRVRIINSEKDSEYATAFSPDGKYLAAAASVPEISLYSVDSGEKYKVLAGSDGVLSVATFSPDGQIVAAAGSDGSLWMWNVANGDRQQRLPPHQASIRGSAVSPDGKRIATVSKDQTLRLWDAETGQVTRVLGNREGAFRDVTFSHDGRRLVWGGQVLRLLDLDGEHTPTLLRSNTDIFRLRLHPEGRLLAVADGTVVRLFDLESQALLHTLDGQGGAVYATALSPDGRHVVSGGLDRVIRLWSTESGALIQSFPTASTITHLDFAANGMSLLASFFDGQVLELQLSDGSSRLVHARRAPIMRMSLAPDQDTFVISSPYGKPPVIQTSDGQSRFTLTGHQEFVNSIAYSPDGKKIVSGSNDTTVRVHEAQAGHPLWQAPALLETSRKLISHEGVTDLETGMITAPKAGWPRRLVDDGLRAVVSPDGATLCLVTRDEQLEIIDLAQAERTHQISVPGFRDLMASTHGCGVLTETAAQSIRWTSDHSTILRPGATAIGSMNDGLLFAESSTVVMISSKGDVKETFELSESVSAIAANDTHLWVGYTHGGIEQISRRASKTQPLVLRNTPNHKVLRIVPGPSSTLLASYYDGTVGLWSLETGALLHQERLHGPVIHLHRSRRKVYAATELGWWLRWDLEAFEQAYCTLLDQIWNAVPVAWNRGQATLTGPPPHACRR